MKWTRLITLSLAALLTFTSMASTFDYRLKLANLGSATAQYALGVMYANGQGAPQDDKQAVKWYQKATEQGYAAAQYNLAVMYHFECHLLLYQCSNKQHLLLGLSR
jgi:TPR repeat protein